MPNINNAVNQAVAGKKTLMQDALEQVVEQLVGSLKAEVTAQIKKQFFSINFERLVQELVSEELEGKIKKIDFPSGSIPSDSIDFTGAQLSGSQITGGTIEKFSSGGIQDLADQTQLTVLNDMVVVEENIVTKNITIQGDAIIDGDIILNGDLPISEEVLADLTEQTAKAAQEAIETEIQSTLAKRIMLQIKQNGFDVANILVNGRKLIDGEGVLAPWIRDTRITQTGPLKELQVDGETYLAGNMYVSHNRVGINTTEPASALAVWDEETEVIIGKRKSQTGYIGTTRSQELVLGANQHENIVMATNGQAMIKDLVADQTHFHSVTGEPDFAGQTGAIAFNVTPKVGNPWGWMCLGGERWGVLGILE